MTNHGGRLYTLALALVAFFLAWAVIAARPWAKPSSTDPRLRALALRETQLRRDAKLVNTIVARRLAAYRVALKARQAQQARLLRQAAAQQAAAASPVSAVQVVNLPPLVVTRTS